jgi:hypothetical protein
LRVSSPSQAVVIELSQGDVNVAVIVVVELEVFKLSVAVEEGDVAVMSRDTGN